MGEGHACRAAAAGQPDSPSEYGIGRQARCACACKVSWHVRRPRGGTACPLPFPCHKIASALISSTVSGHMRELVRRIGCEKLEVSCVQGARFCVQPGAPRRAGGTWPRAVSCAVCAAIARSARSRSRRSARPTAVSPGGAAARLATCWPRRRSTFYRSCCMQERCIGNAAASACGFAEAAGGLRWHQHLMQPPRETRTDRHERGTCLTSCRPTEAAKCTARPAAMRWDR
jgi:hypothetical protein